MSTPYDHLVESASTLDDEALDGLGDELTKMQDNRESEARNAICECGRKQSECTAADGSDDHQDRS